MKWFIFPARFSNSIKRSNALCLTSSICRKKYSAKHLESIMDDKLFQNRYYAGIINKEYWKLVMTELLKQVYLGWSFFINRICFFVCGFTSHTRIFHSYIYGDHMVTITGEGLQILTHIRHSWPLSVEGSLACHTNCDTGHSFITDLRGPVTHAS